MRTLLAAGVALFAWCSVDNATGAGLDDVARYLAGLAPQDQPTLPVSRQTPEWADHASHLDARWGELDRSTLSKIRRLARREAFHEKVAFYLFGGPDFAHAAAFFPDADVYVLSGLEPVADLPDPLQTAPEDRAPELARLRRSLDHFFDFGFFVTKDMRSPSFAGVVPILYVMISRSGGRLQSADIVDVAADGAVTPGDRTTLGTRGVRIRYSDAGGRAKELYYFSVDLANSEIGRGGFLTFCAQLGPGDSLIKNASYLLHEDAFSQARLFLLHHSVAIVQDDSGIPLRSFDQAEWRIEIRGRYRRPVGPFKDFYQPDLDALARRQQPKSIDFAIGYSWWINGPGLQIARKNGSGFAQRR